MNEFKTTVAIDAPADDVFAYVTDFSRMPEYLPTLEKAQPEGPGKVRLKGVMDDGQPYDAVGWYQVHEFNRSLLWGSEDSSHYSGNMEVMDLGERCVLNIALNFDLSQMSPENQTKMEQHTEEVQKGLQASAETIKRACEQATVPSQRKSGGYVS